MYVYTVCVCVYICMRVCVKHKAQDLTLIMLSRKNKVLFSRDILKIISGKQRLSYF